MTNTLHLAPRELQVLQGIANSLTNAQIAKAMFISEWTVSFYRKRIMQKCGLTTMAATIALVVSLGLVHVNTDRIQIRVSEYVE